MTKTPLMHTEISSPIFHFVTYGTAGTHYFRDASNLASVALSTGWFQTSTVYTEEDIPLWAKRKYAPILKLRRGGGYWIWRFPLIQKKVNKIKDGEFIVWLDSDLRISAENSFGSILMEWAELLQQEDKGLLLFQQPHIEKIWTTERIFKAFNVSVNDTYVRETAQTWAGSQLLRKCNDLQDHLALVFSVLDKDPWIITDKYNDETKQDFPLLKENRHDQSINSVTHKVRGGLSVVMILDSGGKYPFKI